jgi:hypothetical protein
MNWAAYYIQKTKLTAIGAWLATLLVAVMGFSLLKKTIVLLLVKMYEWLIELHPFRT